MKTLALSFAFALCLLTGCSKSGTLTGQQATVTLSDGSTFAGTVTSSSGSSITLLAASGESRTYPMTQVSSVQYSPAAPAAAAGAAAPADAPPAASQSATATAPPPAVAQAPPPRAPAPPPVVFATIPAGTSLEVRNNQTIDSETAEAGQTYSGVVARDVTGTDGQVVIPHGSEATLVVRSASGQGKLQGRSDIAVDVGSVTVNGRHYVLQTSDVARRGKEGVGTNKRTGEFAGGGAALGGIIGAIAGGGKGAAIGALSGAGAGTVAQGVTRGKAVRIPAETLLTFRLEAPVDIRQQQ